jgi:hypothetical protein
MLAVVDCHCHILFARECHQIGTLLIFIFILYTGFGLQFNDSANGEASLYNKIYQFMLTIIVSRGNISK